MAAIYAAESKVRSMRISLTSILVLLALRTIAEAGQEKGPELPIIGNFSLPTSQEPAPLVSFGQNIVNKGDIIIELSGDHIRGHNSYFNDVIPNIIYGIRDDLVLYVAVPFSPGSKLGASHSSGIEDIPLQLEYAFFNKNTSQWSEQATVVGNVTLPSGSSSKNPPTGFGSTSYFLGTTFAHMTVKWYAFASPGVILTTSHHGTQFGNQFLYQCGVGRFIDSSPTGWIFEWIVEFDGTYIGKDKFHNVTDPDSGGNTIFITPTIWMSSKRYIFQFGVGFPIVQNLNGHQDKLNMSINYNFAVTF